MNSIILCMPRKKTRGTIRFTFAGAFQLFFVALLTSGLYAQHLDTLRIGPSDVLSWQSDYGVLGLNKSVDGNTLRIGGVSYDRGFGLNSKGSIALYLSPRARQLSFDVGIDDESLPNKGSVVLSVVVDNVTVWKSGVIFGATAAIQCSLPLNKGRTLRIDVSDAGDGNAFDHVDICNLQYVMATDQAVIDKGADTLALTMDDVLSYEQEYDVLRYDSAVGNSALRVASQLFEHGFGTHAQSGISLYINQRCIEFKAAVGVDDNTLPDKGSVEFVVLVDDDTLWRSGIMRTGDSPKLCRVNLENRTHLRLLCLNAGDGNSFDHGDWLNPLLISWKALSSANDTISLSSVPFEDVKESATTRHQIDKSVGKTPIQIGTRTFSHGLGTHANFLLPLALNKKCREFRAWVGPDMSALHVGFGRGTMEFLIIGDGQVLWRSGVMRTGDEPKLCIVDLSAVVYCEFIVSDAEDGFFFDHASWAEARLLFEQGSKPLRFQRPADSAIILTPPQPKAHINGPPLYGVRPRSPVLFRVALSGDEPLNVAVYNLPDGLEFDAGRRIIHGSLAQRGTYTVEIEASNSFSTDHKSVRFIVGDTLEYTPAMGWNTWFVTNEFLFRDTVLENMRSLLKYRLADYGYSYVNLDAGWQRTRTSTGVIGVSDSVGDMRSLVDSIHSYGLKAGLYTSPGTITCVNDPGSFGYEELDAKTYSDWGIDFVKSDWCSASEVFNGHQTHADMLELIKKMGTALAAQPRDIVYSISQYGEGKVWEWAREQGVQYWRTAADNEDNWWMMSVVNGFPNGSIGSYAGPGGWNDYDFLLFGNGRGPVPRRRHTRISPLEQYTHMTLWAIGRSPLLMSFSLTDLDDFTLRLLTNTEVLDIHQDPCRTAGGRVYHPEFYTEVWANTLHDSSVAVAFFNRDNYSGKSITLPLRIIGIADGQSVRVRDCWRQTDLVTVQDSLTLSVPSHGCALVRIFPKGTSDVDQTQSTSLFNAQICNGSAGSPPFIRLEAQSAETLRLQLYDVLGRPIGLQQTYNVYPGSQTISIPTVASLSDGMYFVQLRTTQQNTTLKFVNQH